MSDPLGGVRDKLVRANEHLEELQRELVAFSERQGERFVMEHEPETGDYVVRVHGWEPMPIRIGVLAGEVAFQARSALDNLVYQLVIVATGEAPPSDPHMIQCPIHDTRSDFKNSRRSQHTMSRLTPEMRARLEELQPYTHPKAGSVSAMSLIRDLNDIDKHRVVHVARPRVVGFRPQPPFPPIIESEFVGGPLVEPGAKILRLKLDIAPDHPNMKMEFDVALETTIDEGQGVWASAELCSTLGLCVDLASNITDRFAGLFFQQ